jgi:hypothetical protein
MRRGDIFNWLSRVPNAVMLRVLLTIVSGTMLAAAVQARNVRRLSTSSPHGIIWAQPSNLELRNLFYGAGGPKGGPHGVLSFVKEVTEGSKPKYLVKDGRGDLWIIKVGPEARPEVAASRIVWAVGYFADNNYFQAETRIKGMPSNVKRGRALVDRAGRVREARIERVSSKVEKWSWRENPFIGTRELNGLRILMALLNNWDLKASNNSIDEQPISVDGGASRSRLYTVADLGATFGTTRASWPKPAARGNLKHYSRSAFIAKVSSEQVRLASPGPMILFGFLPFPDLWRLRSNTRNVPLEDAKWVGRLLRRLSPEQIRAAFRAAAYSPAEVEGFSRVIERRIQELNEM